MMSSQTRRYLREFSTLRGRDDSAAHKYSGFARYFSPDAEVSRTRVRTVLKCASKRNVLLTRLNLGGQCDPLC